MRSVVKKTILKVKPYVPGKPVEEVRRELGLKKVIKLASNENPYGPPPSVIKAIERESKNINRYPDADCYYLREALSRKLGIPREQLIFGNGSDEIILLAVRAFVNEGDEVIIAHPSFLIYGIAAQIAGAGIKSIPLDNFHYNLDAMKRAVTKKTKIIFLGNPDNPAGTYLSKKDVDAFLKRLRRDILVFFDEAYYEYVSARDYVDSLALLKAHKNIIITRTFSKMYGLAGLRIGYGIANEELIDLLNRIREPFNVNSVAQAAALACLKEKNYYSNLFIKINEQREFLYKEFKRAGVEFVESCTNFILIRLNKNSTEIFKQLLNNGIIVRDMAGWGMRGFIRITIGTEQENKKLIRVLKNLVF